MKIANLIKNARGTARRIALKRGIALGRFKMVHGWESYRGPEWVAFDRNGGNAFATVWIAYGEDVEECLLREISYRIDGMSAVGITIHK